jgi:hypothetical protein
MLGNHFNEKYVLSEGVKFVTVCNKRELCNGIQLRNGQNIDTRDVNTNGGIYFYDLNTFYNCLNYSNEPIVYIRYITIQNDAEVIILDGRYKANKLILSKRENISNLNILTNYDFCLQMLRKNGLMLQYIDVNKFRDGMGLTIAEENKLSLEAIKQNLSAFQYVVCQNHDLCVQTINLNPEVIQYIRNHSDDLCMQALRLNGYCLKYITHQTVQLCIAAVSQNASALKYVKDKTDDVYLAAVKQNGLILCEIIDQTYKIALAAVKQNGDALQFVFCQTKTLALEAVKQNNQSIAYVKHEFIDYVKTKLNL